ncbi:hypothetical protein NET02_12325 [Thermomicrobiaceae bacterium CFH 74404]|uniref:Uncharacterized protein n=1 Tax=Thermalbibacter longus TaxID=2951981 RepID=A0AA41WBP8_9BACT|nr:hypothetical protein [Thermalbibacter longus]MCM8749936.1 hypothetical protein [Thermalbibacter longus]
MTGLVSRLTILVAVLVVAVGALAWGYWAGARSRSEAGEQPAVLPVLTPAQEQLVREAALAHPTVQAVLATLPSREVAISYGTVNDPAGELAGGIAWMPFDSPQTVRGEWLIPLDWQARWPPSRFEQATYTVRNAEGLLVWVDLGSGRVVRVEATGAYASVDPAEDPRALPSELEGRAAELALAAPWLEPLLAQGKPEVSGVSPVHTEHAGPAGARTLAFRCGMARPARGGWLRCLSRRASGARCPAGARAARRRSARRRRATR